MLNPSAIRPGGQRRGAQMAVKMPPIRLDGQLAHEAAKVLGVNSRTEAIHLALSEIVALKRFKTLMKKHAGKLSFDGYDVRSRLITADRTDFELIAPYGGVEGLSLDIW
jgi:hypothetical protein